MDKNIRGFEYPPSWRQDEKVTDKASHETMKEPAPSASDDHNEALSPQIDETLIRRVGDVVVHLTQRDGFYETWSSEAK